MPKSVWKEINKERSQISNVAPTSKDKDLKELTKLVDDKIGEYRESHQEDIQKKIETNLTAPPHQVPDCNQLSSLKFDLKLFLE